MHPYLPLLQSRSVCLSRALEFPKRKIHSQLFTMTVPAALSAKALFLFFAVLNSKVNRFKGLIIGGGGLFVSRHSPLDCPAFVDELSADLPIAIFGVGARYDVCKSTRPWSLRNQPSLPTNRVRTVVTPLFAAQARL